MWLNVIIPRSRNLATVLVSVDSNRSGQPCPIQISFRVARDPLGAGKR